MDNCPAQPQYLCDLGPNVEVVFLPPNTTSVLQPLDQEIIVCIKSHYHTQVFRQLRAATETNVEIRYILEDQDVDTDDLDDPRPMLPLMSGGSPTAKIVHQF